MNIDKPIAIGLSKPFGIDRRIVEMQSQLSSNVSWLDLVFGRAVAQYEGEQNKRVPKIPIGKGEYFSVMPNDAQKSFAFFYPINPEEPLEETAPYQKSLYFTQRCDLILWCNLQRIDKNNLGLGEQLKDELINQLMSMSGVVIENIYSDDTREVYQGWELDLVQRDLLVYPFYAIKFELRVTVIQNEC